jgi:hypothetical protein
MKFSPALYASRFNGGRLFAVFLIMLIAQTADTTIGSLADILKDFTSSFWGVSLFISISIAYGFGQFFILGMVKAKNKEKEIRRNHFNILEKIVTIVQYVLLTIMVFVVLQILFSFEYNTILLNIAVVVSGGLTVYIMGLLSYSLLSWFRISRAPIVLLYGMAAAMIAINIIAVAVIFNTVLKEKPTIVTPQSNVVFPVPGTVVKLFNTVQTISWTISFLLIWGGTILLLYHNVHRIGKVKFWVLVSTPVILFSSFNLSFYQSILGPVPIGADPIMAIVVPLLLIEITGIISIILIGVGFRSVAKALSHTPLMGDYMMITAYGFVLFYISTTTTIAGTGYPPFGLANVLLYGPFSFLVLDGLYRSAICISEDVKLRKSINTLAKRESKLLDITASAEIQREIQNKVMTTIKANAEILEQQSGVEPSLTDEEIRDHLEIVTRELKKQKIP